MKTKKNLSALVAGIAMLAVTATSLGTATFAWFTRGTEATASGFDFTASAASGIQISTDAVTWKSNIANEDFDTTTPGGAQENNRLSISSMEPVSTIDGTGNLTNGEFNFFTATSGDGSYTLSADTSNYLVFDLYFLNSGANDLTLTLTDDSSVLDGLVDQDTSLSTRVGFVVEGNSSDPATAVGLNGGSSTYIWEPNSITRSTSAASTAGVVDEAKYEYNGIANINSGTAVDTINSYGQLEAGTYSTLVDTTKDIAIGDSGVITVLAGSSEITKVKIFVWMEGQDVDCNNAASEGDVDIALGFDTGAATTQLDDKTADSLDTLATVTTLTMTGAGNIGVTYTTHVLQALTDSVVTLDYRLYLATATDTYSVSDITELVLDNEVSASGTYEVVVLGELTGSIGSRTQTDIVIL